MNDQARQLRQLVIKEALQRAERDECSAMRVRFCSGRSGAGTTTVALNAAIALARNGIRVALVSLKNNTSELPVGLFEPIDTTHSALPGTLYVGPFGLNLLQLTGTDLPGPQLAQIADYVLVDAGHNPANAGYSVDLTVYVTTLDNASILDTYSLMKSQDSSCPALVVANRVNSEQQAWETLKRFCETGVDYSGRKLTPAAVIPDDDSGQRDRDAGLLVLQSPTSAAARRFEDMAERLQRNHRKPSPRDPADSAGSEPAPRS